MYFWPHSKHSYYFVLDVSSHSVNGAIIKLYSGDGVLPKIIKRTGLHFRSSSDGIRTVAKIREFMFDGIKSLEQVPEEIIIGLGSSIAEYAITIWDAALPVGGVRLTKKDAMHFFEIAVESHKESQRRVIPQLLEIYANGYPVAFDAFRGELVDTLSFRVFTIRFSDEVGKAFEEAEKSLGGMPMRFVAHPLVFAEEIRETMSLSDLVGVDMGIADTTITIIKQDIFLGTASFPFGISNLDRSFHEYTKEGYEEKVSEESLKKWKDMFYEALDTLYTLGSVPNTVVITGDGAYCAALRKFFLTSTVFDQFSFVSPPSVRTADAPSFFGGSSLNGSLHGFSDSRIAALIRYVQRKKEVLD